MYDLAIIGSGPAGLAAAKAAVKRNLSVVLVEKQETLLGGTCLNRGCIPTKFLLKIDPLKEWAQLIEEKNLLVNKIRQPLKLYLDKLGITLKLGRASFINSTTIAVDDQHISAKNILVATGSTPRRPFQEKRVLYAEEMLDSPDIGQSVLIVGAGYIGLEFACLLNRLGRKVRVVEKEKSILSAFDNSLSKRLKGLLLRNGIDISCDFNVTDKDFIAYDTIIASVSREPNTFELNLESAGVETKNGWIITDQYQRSSKENIYACGDVTGVKMLAYTAEYQAEVAVTNIAGQSKTVDYRGIPECVFAIPQLAIVGASEQKLKELDVHYRVFQSNFLKFSSSYVYGDTDGFVKVLVDDDNRILGAGIISNSASELISIFSIALKCKLTLSDISKNIFIHPTLSEIIPLFLKEI
ncbi:MAG: NAD(P)/FAD-dependent oxidoreductase [Candidatus Omnitrophica bacterium]|nr:NAD(P)/FAD-dependent oxidoreductase [Candidatus Omnitrophota bacterium]